MARLSLILILTAAVGACDGDEERQDYDEGYEDGWSDGYDEVCRRIGSHDGVMFARLEYLGIC